MAFRAGASAVRANTRAESVVEKSSERYPRNRLKNTAKAPVTKITKVFVIVVTFVKSRGLVQCCELDCRDQYQ